MKVLDTSVAVDHLRGLASASDLLRGLIEGRETIVASEVVRFELLAGVRQEEREALERFFRIPVWVPVSAEVTRMAGRLARQYARSHEGIDSLDYLIAATALLLEAELLTTNVRHFPMLEGLRPPYD